VTEKIVTFLAMNILTVKNEKDMTRKSDFVKEEPERVRLKKSSWSSRNRFSVRFVSNTPRETR